MRSQLLALATIVLSAAIASAAEKVPIVTGAEAPPQEALAARELAAQFRTLFDIEPVLVTSLPAEAKAVVLVGGPKSNPAVKGVVGEDWPKLSDQGFVLRSFRDGDRRGLIVAGGSPVATLWAAYELGHRYGIRYLLREDVYPVTPLPLKLDGYDVVMEPTFPTRAWQTIDEFAHGQESWGLDAHRRLLKQLAKMKFNRITLSIHPWQPFVDYAVDGVRKQTAVLWHGRKYRVDGDTPGRVAFRGASLFENSDLAGKTTPEDRTRSGIALAQGIIAETHRLGMQAAIAISPLEFPREFAAVLPGAKSSAGTSPLVVVPGGGQQPDDPHLQKLIAAKVRAYLETYPTVDALELTLPMIPEWDAHAERAWRRLDEQYNLGGREAYRKLIESGRSAGASGGGKPIVGSQLAALAYLQPLFADEDLRRRPDGRAVELVVANIAPALGPILDRMLPSGAAAQFTVQDAASHGAEMGDLLPQTAVDKLRSRLMIALTDDDVGVLSQSALRRSERLIQEIRRRKWDGFSVHCRGLGELDPTVHYLSRAAFDENVTARSAHDDLFVTLTGKPAAADRLWLAFEHIEAAAELIGKHAPRFAFPTDGMLLQHARAEPLPDWWPAVLEHYSQAMIEFYRSRGAAHPRTRPFLYYYAKRSEYVLSYLNCIQAVRESALARQKGDMEAAIGKLETAIEALHDAINIVGDVVETPDDLGLMAVLTAHAFRPLMAEYERQLEAAESE